MNNFRELLESKYNQMINSDCSLDRQQNTFNSVITLSEMKDIVQWNYVGNRDFNKANFRKYVRAMNLDRWVLSPDPLVFVKMDGTWVLYNGQHRGEAQVETGKTIPYTICIRADDQIYKYLDQGKFRSNADITGAHNGVVHPIQFLLRAASSIVSPTPEDVDRVLNDHAGSLLSEVEYDIKPPKTGKSIWKQTGFRAAYSMAIMTNRIDHDEAYDLYNCLSRNEINEWPPIFLALYRQVMEGQIHINRSGQSLDNDYFMRGMYAFQRAKTAQNITIHNGFRTQVKIDVAREMKKYATEELRVAA